MCGCGRRESDHRGWRDAGPGRGERLRQDTLGRCIVARLPAQPAARSSTGRRSGDVDLATLEKKDLRPYRRDLRMMFQDPYSSLNPRMTVLDIVGEPLRINKRGEGKEVEERVAATLERVGLRPEYMRRYPHAFSGGQRQRIGIARAIVLDRAARDRRRSSLGARSSRCGRRSSS